MALRILIALSVRVVMGAPYQNSFSLSTVDTAKAYVRIVSQVMLLRGASVSHNCQSAPVVACACTLQLNCVCMIALQMCSYVTLQVPDHKRPPTDAMAAAGRTDRSSEAQASGAVQYASERSARPDSVSKEIDGAAKPACMHVRHVIDICTWTAGKTAAFICSILYLLTR